MQYTADGLLTSFTDRNGNTTTFAYDDNGRLIRDDDPEGGGWQLSRTELEDGYRVDMTSGEGRVHSFELARDTTGDRVYTDEAPDGTTTTRTYENSGRSTIERPDGTIVQTVEGPDPRFGMGAPVPESHKVTLPSGLELVRETERTASLSEPADPMSLQSVTETVTVNGRVTSATYDAGEQQWAVTSPEGRSAATTVDGQGRPLTQSVPGLAPVSRSYDDRGRLSSLEVGTGAEERSAEFAYYDATPGDQAGYLRSISDPAGRVTTFARDAVGRVISQTLPGGRSVGYQYDANGNLTAITPPDRSAHVFSYDGLDQRSDYQPPELDDAESVTRYTYNLDRQLTAVDMPGDASISYQYDAGGRLATRDMSAGSVTYSYDLATGQLTDVATSDGINLQYSWDGFLPTETAWSGPIAGTVARSYDANFWLTQETVAGTGISFSYDNDGLLTQAGSLNIARDADNGLVTGTTLTDVAGSRQVNSFGELSSRQLSVADSTVYDVSYTRDELGRITEKTETVAGQAHTWSYDYDDAGRLVAVRRDGLQRHSYSYDANGNRVSHGVPGGGQTGSYDAQDRLQSYGDATYSHTETGMRQSKTTPAGTTTYDYDAVGNLRGVSLADGTEIDYLIDGQDRRVGKQVDGTLEKGWLYRDRLNPVAELDGQGNVTARFVYGAKLHVPAYMIKDGTTYRIVSDHLGSVRLVINTDTNEIVQRLAYSPFGKVTNDTNPGFQPFGFAGGLYDPDTGLVRFGARDYDPEVGRWTAKDPISFGGGDANLYTYVGNSPINRLDPSGLWRVEISYYLGVGGSLIFGVNDATRQSFIGGALGIGVGGGVNIDPNGSTPEGANNRGCDAGTSFGGNINIGASIPGFDFDLFSASGGVTVLGGTGSQSNPPSGYLYLLGDTPPATIGSSFGVSIGATAAIQVIGGL